MRGSKFRSLASFKTFSRALVDPDTITCTIEYAGNVTTWVYGTDVQIVRSAVGKYYCDLSIPSRGELKIKWTSIGAGEAEQEVRYAVY